MKIQDINLKILSSALREDDLPGTGLGEEDPPWAAHDEDDHPGDVLGRDCLLEVSWMEMTSEAELDEAGTVLDKDGLPGLVHGEDDISWAALDEKYRPRTVLGRENFPGAVRGEDDVPRPEHG